MLFSCRMVPEKHGVAKRRQEEEEEVSGICPTESSETCAAQSIDTNIFGGESEGKALLWSPLSPEKLEEMMSEANRLAALMEGCELLEKENGTSETRLEMVPDFEPLPSIESLHAVRKDSRAARRRTFNVSNSPLQALLPTVGPESCCSVGSPKAPLPEMGSPTSCVADPPVPKRRQNKSNACIPNNQLPKKSRPNQPLKSLAATKSLDIKKTTTRCSRKERSTPPTLPTQNKKPLPSLRPPLQTNRQGPWRETEKSSGKASSSEGSQLGLQDPPSKGKKPVPYAKARLGPRLDPLKTGPVKKASVAPEKVAHLPKANASQVTSMGGSAPQLQASYKPHSSCREIRTRNTAKSGLASRLPVLNSNTPAFQQTVPSGTSQNSRLRLPKKATSGKSSLAVNRSGAG
ncbi:proline/serine-rich coiled-coil protein 1 isoform X2 [Podarcis raffonei]|uniref:proline/serine-rich coiled-coil protein 1 isoform X2 n=1 Tax=Podarcis raffonei TaxID=65483 RepID=UPI0023291F65|nr:proline/serine-rich coiled-coil protein 1 isoform X2 [Podarcis raffonei]